MMGWTKDKNSCSEILYLPPTALVRNLPALAPAEVRILQGGGQFKQRVFLIYPPSSRDV